MKKNRKRSQVLSQHLAKPNDQTGWPNHDQVNVKLSSCEAWGYCPGFGDGSPECLKVVSQASKSTGDWMSGSKGPCGEGGTRQKSPGEV